MQKTIQTKKRSSRDSLERVDDYLRQQKEFVALSRISRDLRLPYQSVKKCIFLLEKFGRIKKIISGRIVLVKFKKEKKENGSE